MAAKNLKDEIKALKAQMREMQKSMKEEMKALEETYQGELADAVEVGYLQGLIAGEQKASLKSQALAKAEADFEQQYSAPSSWTMPAELARTARKLKLTTKTKTMGAAWSKPAAESTTNVEPAEWPAAEAEAEEEALAEA